MLNYYILYYKLIICVIKTLNPQHIHRAHSTCRIETCGKVFIGWSLYAIRIPDIYSTACDCSLRWDPMEPITWKWNQRIANHRIILVKPFQRSKRNDSVIGDPLVLLPRNPLHEISSLLHLHKMRNTLALVPHSHFASSVFLSQWLI